MLTTYSTVALVVVLAIVFGVGIWKLRKSLDRSHMQFLSRIDDLELTFSRAQAIRPYEHEGRICTSIPSDAVVSYGNPGANVEILLCPLPPASELKVERFPEVSRNGVSDFILKTAALFGQATGVRTLAVRFSPEIARQLQNGQLELMRSALSHKACAIDPTNGHRIVELGDIVQSFNPMAATAFAWQIMAFITAQKFLSDINTKLAAIGNQINEIRSFLISQEESSLIANHEYLKQIATSVSKGNLGPEDVVVIGTQLEDIERQTCTTMHVALKAIRSTTEELTQRHESVWTEKGLEECIAYEREKARHVASMSHMLLSALAVRSSATYLRAILPLNKAIAQNRLMLIREDLESYSGSLNSFRNRIHLLNDSMTAKADWFLAPKEFIEKGKQEIEAQLRPLEGESEAVSTCIGSIAEALRQTSAPHMLLYAQVNGGDVTLFSSAGEQSEREPSK